MILKKKYTTLNDALKLFRLQVIESINFLNKNFEPEGLSPEEIFNYLKKNTTYIKDPKGVELFQTYQTFFYKNFHRMPGAGDCDCFTIAALAELYFNNYRNIGIVLVGRSRIKPVHIYAYVKNGSEYNYLDLTNKVFNFERNYPYRQHIPLKI